MKAEQVIVEKTMTAQQLLESKNLDPKLYLVSQEGKVLTSETMVKAGIRADVIPAIKGG